MEHYCERCGQYLGTGSGIGLRFTHPIEDCLIELKERIERLEKFMENKDDQEV